MICDSAAARSSVHCPGTMAIIIDCKPAGGYSSHKPHSLARVSDGHLGLFGWNRGIQQIRLHQGMPGYQVPPARPATGFNTAPVGNTLNSIEIPAQTSSRLRGRMSASFQLSVRHCSTWSEDVQSHSPIKWHRRSFRGLTHHKLRLVVI